MNRGVSLEEANRPGSAETTWRNWRRPSTMPEPIYVRSFVKTYANYLDLDETARRADQVPAGTEAACEARSPCGITESGCFATAFSDQVGSQRFGAVHDSEPTPPGSLNARTRFVPSHSCN